MKTSFDKQFSQKGMIKSQSVVFFLGAGFSAPFGLPVMSNFIDKARDLYFSDPDNYEKENKMSIIVKSSNENVISLPIWLMRNLSLTDGEEVKTLIDGKTLRLSSLDQFLALRGSLSDDEQFDTGIEFIDKAWDSWKQPLTSNICTGKQHTSSVS